MPLHNRNTGNSNYDLNLEYSGLAKELFSRPWYYFFLTIYLTYTVTANIAMGRIVAQAADDFIVLVSGHDYALQFYPTFGFVKSDTSTYFYNNPGHLVLAITVGYLIAAIILAPMALFQLMAALGVQAFLLILVFLACVEFVAFFIKQGVDAKVPLFGSNWTQVMGPIIFNLGVGGGTYPFSPFLCTFLRTIILTLCSSLPISLSLPRNDNPNSSWNATRTGTFRFGRAPAMPTWLNQKMPHLKTKTVVAGVSFSMMILNVALPILGVYVYGDKITSDIFELMTTINTTTLVRVGVYVYTLTVIGASIPINSIMVKNNLYTEVWANVPFTWFIGIFLQYLVGWLALSGGIFTTFLNYISLFLGGFSGFFFPIAMYYIMQRNYVLRTGSPGSPLGLIPARLLPYWRVITLAVLLLTALPTLGQIFVDFYFLIFLHKNVV